MRAGDRAGASRLRDFRDWCSWFWGVLFAGVAYSKSGAVTSRNTTLNIGEQIEIRSDYRSDLVVHG